MSDQHSTLSLEEPSTSRQLRARVNFKDRHYEQSVEHMLSEIIGGDDDSLSGFGNDDTDVDPNYHLSGRFFFRGNVFNSTCVNGYFSIII